MARVAVRCTPRSTNGNEFVVGWQWNLNRVIQRRTVNQHNGIHGSTKGCAKEGSATEFCGQALEH
ncbi:hypothetical protein BGAL_0009g00390 [Botrytis galanthina]|uniref:Uncharacterized protein n=1 Tax=Botrytis galanthina TaxID=278940 RepID=A0A4S8RKQ3_9HELO|nr:hypothetical protein BGAL_0009g00390 [Botrytis galanthina]